MRKNKFTDMQIIKSIKEVANCRLVAEVSRKLGINPQNLYNWKKKFADMESEAG